MHTAAIQESIQQPLIMNTTESIYEMIQLQPPSPSADLIDGMSNVGLSICVRRSVLQNKLLFPGLLPLPLVQTLEPATLHTAEDGQRSGTLPLV